MALFQNVQEEFQWEEYLRANFDVKNTPSDELRICCFVCGDTKYKLYVNPTKRHWHCFLCTFGSGQFDTFDFVSKAENVPRARIITRLLREYARTTPDDPMFQLRAYDEAEPTKAVPIQPIKVLSGLPSAAKLLTERTEESAPFWDYLISRGLTPQEIFGVRIHYIAARSFASYDTRGKYRGDIGYRIITPIYGGNKELVSWQARVVDPNHVGHDKYLTAPESEIAKTLWPCVQPYGKHAVLVEGVLDCVSMRRIPSVSAYATFSKKISLDQIRLLKSWGVTELTVFWDKKDARKEIIHAVKELHMHFTKVYVSKMTTWPSNKDPGSLLTDPDGARIIQEALDDKLDTYDSLSYGKWQLTF